MKNDLIKKIVAVMVVLAAVIGSGYYGHQQGEAKGYDEGYADASVIAAQKYNEGYAAGYNKGYEDADLDHIWDDLKT